jgi:hypothetical protein
MSILYAVSNHSPESKIRSLRAAYSGGENYSETKDVCVKYDSPQVLTSFIGSLSASTIISSEPFHYEGPGCMAAKKIHLLFRETTLGLGTAPRLTPFKLYASELLEIEADNLTLGNIKLETSEQTKIAIRCNRLKLLITKEFAHHSDTEFTLQTVPIDSHPLLPLIRDKFDNPQTAVILEYTNSRSGTPKLTSESPLSSHEPRRLDLAYLSGMTPRPFAASTDKTEGFSSSQP